jgi:hypothetical protein
MVRNVMCAIILGFPCAIFAQWTQIGLPGNSRAVSLAVNGNGILAGTQKGVYRSENNGESWSAAGLSNDTVSAIAAGNGKTFAFVTHRSGSVISSIGFYVSSDGGTSWSKPDIGFVGFFTSIIVSGGILYVGTGNSGIFRSVDSGSQWEHLSAVSMPVFSLAASGSTLCAGTSNGVHLSTDNGTNWTTAGLQNASISVNAVAVSGNYFFAGTQGGNGSAAPYNRGGVYVSNNFGASWNPGGLSNDTIVALAAGDPYLFAAGKTGVVWRRLLSDFHSGVISDKSAHPASMNRYKVRLSNKTGPFAAIEFHLPQSKLVELKFYDVSGHEVSSITYKNPNAGALTLNWDTGNLAAGRYTISVKAGASHSAKSISIVE